MKRLGVVTAALMIAASLNVTAQAKTSENTVFQIGASGGAARGGFGRRALSQPVLFIVGKSDPSRDWPAFQPIQTASNSPNAAPHTIQFTLQHSPASTYTLHLSLLISEASLPMLGVNINGHFGTFYLTPKLDNDMGGSYPALASAEVQFEFPGSYLHAQGVNTIALSAIATSASVVPGSGFRYGGITLTSDPQGRFDTGAATVTVTPTIFYKQDAGLKEVVNARIRYRAPIRKGTVELTVNGKRYTLPVQGEHDFGETNCSFLLPDFGAQAKATGEVRINGRTQRFEQVIEPKKKWTLYLVPHVHIDIGYTDYQAKVGAIQSRIMDEALDLMEQHPDFRFSTDGMFSLQNFMATRSDRDQARAMAALHSEHLFVPAEYSNQLTGFPTAEALIRSLYPSANFSREHGTPFNYANITDVPSYSWSYASILPSAGIHYLVAAINDGRAPSIVYGHLDQDSPFWWKGPDGKEVLTWFSKHYHQVSSLFGLPFVIGAGEDTLPVFLQRYEHPSYLSDSVIVYGTQVENSDLFPQQATLAGTWNNIYAYPHLKYSGFHEAMEHIASQFGDKIPTVTGGGGAYWEDGIASDSFYAAMEKNTESRAPSAEKMVTISNLVNPRLSPNKDILNTMWQNIVLMDEHTYNASGANGDPETSEVKQQSTVKNSYALQADWAVDHIMRTGMANLANSISAGPSNLVVFNMLNWKRSGMVEADVRNGDDIVDTSTGQKVPVEVMRRGRSVSHMKFLAQDVPSVGYKVYELRSTGGTEPAGAAAQPAAQPAAEPANQAVSGNTMENSYYRIELDPETGSVRSIYDKQLNRPLVDDQSPYRFGQYLYVTNDARTPGVRGPQRYNVHGATQGRVVSIERTPLGEVAHLESSDTNTPSIDTEILLFNNEKKIEFIENVDKKEVTTREAVYFAFPFAMTHPSFRYEIQTASVDPSKDLYPGGDVAWFAVQHWVSAEQDGVSGTVFPLDVPMVTLGDITHEQFPREFGTRKGWIFSYVMNNYWGTNYFPEQGGHFRFRYVVTSAPTTQPAVLSHMGWEEATPLEVDTLTSSDKAVRRPEPLSGTQGSFLQTSDPALLLEAWKPAEDGNGTILRFLDLGGQDRKVTVQIPVVPIESASRTDSVERGSTPLQLAGTHGFELQVQPHEIVTVRLTTGAQTPSSNQ